MKAFAAVFLPLLIAHAAALQWIWDLWLLPESYYSHGPLLPLLAAFLVWRWRPRWSALAARPDVLGWCLLGPGLLCHLAGAALTIDSLSAASLVLTLPGAVWLALGAARTRALWPLLGLLVFAVPLPLFASGRLAFELKELAVTGGLSLANALGLEGVRQGAHLSVPGSDIPLLVEDPCGGLRSLLALTTLGYCFAFLIGERGRRRALILLAAVPLAVGLNMLRIAALCFAAKWWGVEYTSTTAHDIANAAVWLAALLAMIGLDRLLPRKAAVVLPRKASLAVEPAPSRASASRAFAVSALLLWLSAPGLAFLSFYRPFTTSEGRAERVPTQFAHFTLAEETPLTPRERMLLGTDDAVSRTYHDAQGHTVFLVAVFHQHNWKSVHPPHLCLRGSDMLIESDGVTDVMRLGDGQELTAGRIVTRNRADQRRYLSLFTYGAQALATGSYSEFVWYHLPRAVLRRSAPGYLLRVEAWLDEGDAEARCRAFLQAAMPTLHGLLDG